MLQIIIFVKEKEPNIYTKTSITILLKVFLKIRNILYALIKKKKKGMNERLQYTKSLVLNYTDWTNSYCCA